MPVDESNRTVSGRAWILGLMLLCAAIASLWIVWSPPGANDVEAGDEGYYGVMARNVLADARYLVSPSLHPLGPPGDKPPLYPAILAPFVQVLGPGELALRLPSILFSILLAFLLGLFVGRAFDPRTGLASAVFLLALPWFADTARNATAEIPLTVLGVSALAVLGSGPVTVRRSIPAGGLLGLAFLCKIWLVAFLVSPALALLWPGRHGSIRPLLALLGSAGAVGGAQLLAVALVRPQDLGHWWSVYWSFSLSSRLGGEAYPDYWIQPPGYYWGILSHALVLLLPLAAIGFEALVRRFHTPVARALLVWATGLLVLSVFRVKTGTYLFPVLPAWVAVAAVGARELSRGTGRFGVFASVLLIASSPPIVDVLGGPVSPWILWAGSWGLALGALRLVRLRPARAPALAVGLAALAVTGGLVRQSQRLPLRYHDTDYREVAAVLADELESAHPATVSYLAPEAPAFGYYLFRTGRYWETPHLPWTEERFEAMKSSATLRAFVVDPTRTAYGGWPDSSALAWLDSAAVEITPRLERRWGRSFRLRVFLAPEREPHRDADRD